MPLVSRLRAAACLSALLTLVSGGAAASERLSASLRSGEVPGEVVFELRNDGTASVDVLRFDTPLENTLAADVFVLRRVGKSVDGVAGRAVYAGRLYKRAAPAEEDFVTIAPGESASAVIDLESHYDVPVAGTYRVDYRGIVRHAASATRRSGAALRAGLGLSRTVLGARGPGVELAPTHVDLRARPPRFNACTADEQAGIVEATGAAEGITGEALSSLLNLPEPQRATSPRYARWFGAYTPERYARVSANFDNILGALSEETLTYDCSCDESSFAFVYPSRPYDIYLCRAFFAADVLGTDSRAGTIVHELSHFTVLAGTADHAYGASTLALASNDPDRAIDNADNHEYFAENTPALPMVGSGEAPTPEEPRDEDPSGPTDGGPLEVGETVNGSLGRRQSVVFTVEGPVTLTLTSLSGDADLLVFDSTTFDEDTLVCRSDEETPVDVCEIAGGGTFYAGVEAFTDATFQLSADGSGGQTPTPETPIADGGRLEPGTSAGGSLGASEAVVFTVEGPVTLTLTSLGGDADLYVSDSTTFDEDTLVCVSEEETAVDACEITGSGTFYVGVRAFSDATFQLSAGGSGGQTPTPTPAPTPTPTPIDPVPGRGPVDEGTDPEVMLGGGSGGGGGLGWAWFLSVAAFVAIRRRSGASGNLGGPASR